MTKKWHPDEQRWLTEFLEAVAKRHAKVVKEVFIYGSKARGDWHDDSDIDVLLIIDNNEEDAQKAIRQMGQRLAIPSQAVPSIMTRTEAEWARLGAIDSAFHETVEREGVRVL